MVKHGELPVRTHERCGWTDITAGIRRFIAASRIANGVCTAASAHTTAGLTINENADPTVGLDFFRTLERLIPHQGDYRHGEGNSDAHVKASLTGLQVQVPVRDGDLALGTWQAVYFCEFDGPRDRLVFLTMMGE